MPLTSTALLCRASLYNTRHVRRSNRVGLGAPTLPSRRLALSGSLLAAFAAAAYVPGRAMAWRSSGASNDELIDNLYKNDVITDR
jgi:hypothetical protein